MKKSILKIVIFVMLLVPILSNALNIAQTNDATNVEDTTATISGASTGATHTYFRYSTLTKPPVYCNDIFGNNMKYSGDLKAGGTATYNLTGLLPNTKYYYCFIGSNDKEIFYGSVKSFTTKPCKTCPQTTITTKPALVIDTKSANLRGEYTSTKEVTTYFEYKESEGGGDWKKSPEVVHPANTNGKISFIATELKSNTLHEFRAVGRTTDPVETFYGEILNFKTLKSTNPLDQTEWIYDTSDDPEDIGGDTGGPLGSCPEGWTGIFPDCIAPPFECPEGWTGEYPICVQSGECPEGYTGTYPICIPPASCPEGWTGTPPDNCIAPEFPCPEGWTGTPPSCVPPPFPCPEGWTGTSPNCVSPNGGNQCPEGWTGTSPNCVPPPFPCPEGWTGTSPNCVAPPLPCPAGWEGASPNCTMIPGENPCPAGYTGTYPNCSYNGSCPAGWSGTYPVCTSPNDNNQCPPLWTGTYPICINPNNTEDNGSDLDNDDIPNILDPDIDGDGIPNNTDPDDDNDGTPDAFDDFPGGVGNINDYDGDGTPNTIDWDIDGDNIPNVIDNDTDGDGIPNSTDPDDDNDRILDIFDKSHTGIGTFSDFNGDGIPNSSENYFGTGQNNGGVLGGNNNIPSKMGDIVVPPNDAIVRYHEGVETVFIRQIKRNTVLQQKYGHKEEADLQAFANYLAHFFGKNYGYVAKNRQEVRVRYPDVAAYELREIGGATIVYESYLNKVTGNFEITGIRKLNSIFKLIFKYEYYFLKKR